MKRGFKYGRGICPRCGGTFRLDARNLVMGHPCPPHPIGYAQGNDRPARILQRAFNPPPSDRVPLFWFRAGYGL